MASYRKKHKRARKEEETLSSRVWSRSSCSGQTNARPNFSRFRNNGLSCALSPGSRTSADSPSTTNIWPIPPRRWCNPKQYFILIFRINHVFSHQIFLFDTRIFLLIPFSNTYNMAECIYLRHENFTKLCLI